MKKIGILFWDEYRHGYRSHEMNKNFIQAIEKSGALPIGIPSVMEEEEMDRYLDMVDVVILTGGEDISPFLYEEEPLAETNELNIERDRSEYRFIQKAFAIKKPTLAVCRGMQLVNAVFGGSLYQNIPSQKKDSIIHLPKKEPTSNGRFKRQYHSIEIKEGSRLYECLGDRHIVNSYHHQAIKKLADNLKITATAKDGIIEGVETKDDHLFIGIQFHPEFSEDSEDFQKIFGYFVGGLD